MTQRWLSHKNLIAVGHDCLMAALSFMLAITIRLGGDAIASDVLWLGTGLFTVVSLTVFVVMKQYRGIWRYASIQDVVTICKSATLAILIFLPLLFLLTRLDGYPRSALFINWLLLMGLLAAPRLFYRMLRERNMAMLLGKSWQWLFPDDHRIPVLLIGMNNNAELFLRGCQRTECSPYKVVAILDEDIRRQGRSIHGVKVMGRMEHLPKVLHKLRLRGQEVQQLVLGLGKLPGGTMRQLLATAEAEGLSMAQLPNMEQLEKSAEQQKLRPIAIEDLLGRPQVAIHWDNISALIAGRRVLVTGAGGTIGGELARSIARLAPSKLMLLDHSEFGLYNIDQNLAELAPSLTRQVFLADVRDGLTIRHILMAERPDIIFHAAAIKHVPMAEHNPCEAVLTNVVGTRNLADAAREAGCLAMVMISTDKAVNPTSLMGATKRAAERYCQAVGEEISDKHPTRFMTVRFGNVLGSTGSVVPLFRKQLEKGGPLTVTDPGMVRYFMTVQEAVHLVLQASVAGASALDESGQIFVLDMGEPVKIMDLAEKMIRLSGLIPGKDIQIETIGIRTGEKLYEELFYPEEAPEATGFAGIMLAKPQPIAARTVRRQVDTLERSALMHDLPKLMQALALLVPEYAMGDKRNGR